MGEALKVDLRKIIGSKNPKLLKQLPGFLLNWVERFIHQDEINFILNEGKDEKGPDFINTIFRVNNVTLKSQFIDRIPETGGCIIAANHPLGGVDGLALMAEVSKRRKDFLFLANDILLNISPLKDSFLPVNKVGSTNRDSLAKISEAYASGKVIIVFPSGLVSRKIDGVVQDLAWQKSVVQKASQHQLPIIPTFIDGQNSKRFYRIAKFRKIFGIKANLEMFTLPDEMFKQKGQTINMIFGKPISPDMLHRKKPIELAERMRQLIYKLKENPDAELS